MAAAKPQLRGLLASSMKKHLTITFFLSFGAAGLYRTFIAEPKKKIYADFYKTYDADAAFQVMRKAGLLQSCSPDD